VLIFVLFLSRLQGKLPLTFSASHMLPGKLNNTGKSFCEIVTFIKEQRNKSLDIVLPVACLKRITQYYNKLEICRDSKGDYVCSPTVV